MVMQSDVQMELVKELKWDAMRAFLKDLRKEHKLAALKGNK